MDKLKEDVMSCMTQLNKEWVTAIKKAERDGLDLSDMFDKYSEITQNLDKHFLDAKLRASDKKKKGFLG